MLRKLLGAFLVIVVLGLAGCGEEKKTSLLDDISGVWKEKGENALMTIQYTDKKVRLLFGDTFIPVTVGDIDEQNRTVNFNVKQLGTGKLGVWTVRQIWDNKEKTSFHLGITLHDGSQGEFGFVRKVSTDDLNRIASLEVKSEAAASPQSVEKVAVAEAAPVTPVLPAPEETKQEPKVDAPAPQPIAPSPAPTQAASFAPSFDCTKASNGPERLICSNRELSELDVELVQAYKRLLAVSPDKDSVKKEQNEWRKSERDACSAADCMAKAYRDRIDNLVTMSQYLNKPAQFR